MTLKYSITPEERRSKFRRILNEKGFARGIGVHDGLSALIAQKTQAGEKEFDFFWASSLCDSASKGIPDIELGGISARIERLREILRVTDKPIVVDGDTGGDTSHFEYDIISLEDLGISAVIIEDKIFPKRNSLSADAKQEQEDIGIFSNKIKAGKKVQRTKEFMIIARIESLIANKGMQDAIKRAEAYLKAGADGIMIHSKSLSPEEVLKFAEEYHRLCGRLGERKPLVCIPTTYNEITEEELKKKGFNIVIYANQLLRASYKSMGDCAKKILSAGRSLEVEPDISSIKEILKVVGFEDVVEKDKAREIAPSVIILSAGEHRELGQNPSLIEIAGKKVLEHQIEIIKKCGINNIYILVGYEKEKFPKLQDAVYITNEDYKEKGILHSLMCAQNNMENGFVYLNGDILFDEMLFKEILKKEGDIVLAVDDSYKYHQHGQQKMLDAVITSNAAKNGMRHLRFGDNKVIKIGKNIRYDEMNYEFIGLAKFSPYGAEALIKTYHDCLKSFGIFHEAESIEKASDTDMWQEMISRGFALIPHETRAGWIELHNEQDIQSAESMLKEKS